MYGEENRTQKVHGGNCVKYRNSSMNYIKKRAKVLKEKLKEEFKEDQVINYSLKHDILALYQAFKEKNELLTLLNRILEGED